MNNYNNKRSIFRRLKNKFLLISMSLVTLVILLIFTSLYILMKKNGEYLLYTQINEVMSSMRIDPAGEVSSNGKDSDSTIIALIDNTLTNVAYKTNALIDHTDMQNIIFSAMKQNRIKGIIKLPNYSFAYVKKISPFGIQMVLLDASTHLKTLNWLVMISIFVGGAALIVLYILCIYIVNRAVAPVETAFNNQKRFIADASHELKTPLAVISTNMDLIESNPTDTVESQKKWIGYIKYQIERMSGLISDMLYLAKVDNNEQLGVKTEFNLSDELSRQMLTFEAVAFENDVEITDEIQPDISMIGNKEAMIQLIGILVDNAIKNSYKNTNIEITLKKLQNRIHLTVANTGDVIGKEHIDKIFDRFYRVDDSRSREKGGYGLGLSIAKSIVENHNGTITVESKDNKTTFTVVI